MDSTQQNKPLYRQRHHVIARQRHSDSGDIICTLSRLFHANFVCKIQL